MTQPAVFNPASIQLFSRSSVITVGTIQVSNIGQSIGLDAWFQVRRSLKANEPNTCDLRLYNLAPSTLSALAAATQTVPSPANAPGSPLTVVPVKIVAGYEGGTSTIFLGEMRSAQTITDGADNVTELTTGDGDFATILARSVASFPPGTNAYTVAVKMLADMNLGQGNLSTVAPIMRASNLYSGGVVLKSSSWDHLRDLCASCGLEVSIQGGVAQFMPLGTPLIGQAYLLSSDTGLIGSPSVDTKNVLTCKTEMLPGIAPGVAIQLSSKYVKGTFRVTSVTTTGDTAGDDWCHEIEAKPQGWAP